MHIALHVWNKILHACNFARSLHDSLQEVVDKVVLKVLVLLPCIMCLFTAVMF